MFAGMITIWAVLKKPVLDFGGIQILLETEALAGQAGGQGRGSKAGDGSQESGA